VIGLFKNLPRAPRPWRRLPRTRCPPLASPLGDNIEMSTSRPPNQLLSALWKLDRAEILLGELRQGLSFPRAH
jgi:hypothetical protein